MFTGTTRNEANISIETYINKFLDITNKIGAIEKHCEKCYWKMHELKDASTGATCLECLFENLSKGEKLNSIKS